MHSFVLGRGETRLVLQSREHSMRVAETKEAKTGNPI